MFIRPSLTPAAQREIDVAVSAPIDHAPSIGGGARSSAITVSNLMQIREHAVLCGQCVIGRDAHIGPSAGLSVYLGTGAHDVQFRDTLTAEPVL